MSQVHFQYAQSQRAAALAAVLADEGVGVRVLGRAHCIWPDALRVAAPRHDERDGVAAALTLAADSSAGNCVRASVPAGPGTAWSTATGRLACGRERVRPPLLAALALSMTGAVLVLVSERGLAISGLGIMLALSSGLIYARYLLVSRELGWRSDSMVAACWLAAGAALSCLGRGIVVDGLDDPSRHWQLLLGYGTATALAFWLTFAALFRIGASRTAVVMTLEAVVATALGAAVLGEHLGFLQAIGGMSILVAAGLIAWSADPVHQRSRAAPDSAGDLVTGQRTPVTTKSRSTQRLG